MKFTAFKMLHLLALVCLFLTPFSATAGTSTARVIDVHPISYGPQVPTRLSCQNILLPGEVFQVVVTDYSYVNGQSQQATQLREETDQRSHLIGPLVERVFADWVNDRDYTPEQMDMLRKRDLSLEPRRTMYVHLETDGHPAMLRVFDGSTRVLKGGAEWRDASRSPGLTPIEINNANYKLPERRWAEQYPDRPGYFWEIGLLNIDRHLKVGVESAFSSVAELLDLHYNNHEATTMGKTETIEQRGMMIYAQTRPNRVQLFRKYGFEPIMAVSTSGVAQPYEVSPGLILMSIKGSDFIKRHYTGRRFAPQKKQEDIFDAEKAEREIRSSREYISRIDAQRIPLRSFEDLQREGVRVFTEYTSARMMTGRSDDRKNKIIDFFEHYLVLINSIPTGMRHNNWQQLKNLVIECMGRSSPLEAFFHFSLSIDKVTRANPTPNFINEEAENQFFSTPAQQTALLLPSEPSLILRFPYR